MKTIITGKNYSPSDKLKETIERSLKSWISTFQMRSQVM